MTERSSFIAGYTAAKVDSLDEVMEYIGGDARTRLLMHIRAAAEQAWYQAAHATAPRNERR